MALCESNSPAELEPISRELELFLKPLAKAQITVKLPKITVPGQSISNWDLMERLKKAVNPIQLEAIRVRESSLESVVFDAELATKPLMKQAIKLLDGISMKVGGFSEPLRVKTTEAKSEFPSRHDWDLFYLKNKMNESQPGERPDTVYLAKIPVKWFNDGIVDGPSEALLTKAMTSFGTVRQVDIPMCDPLRARLPAKLSGIQMKGLGFGQEVFFEAYVQFVEYKGFLSAMAALRNMKWAKRIDGKLYQATVKVDFDRSRHLSDVIIARRNEEREKLLAAQRKTEKEQQKAKEVEENARLEEEREKERRREERELKRKQKREDERRREEEEREKERVAREREMVVKEQKEQEGRRLLEGVFRRIQEKEDRRKRNEEARLVADLRKVDEGEIGPDEREQTLREALLIQREMRMREMLKEKMRQPSRTSQDSSDEERESSRRRSRHSRESSRDGRDGERVRERKRRSRSKKKEKKSHKKKRRSSSRHRSRT